MKDPQQAWNILSQFAKEFVNVGFSPQICQRLIDDGHFEDLKNRSGLAIGAGTGASIDPLISSGYDMTLIRLRR